MVPAPENGRLYLHDDLRGGHMSKVKGDKSADTLAGTPAKDKIIGWDGDDIIFGLGGDDQINGGAGDDLITGGAGNDKIDGGKGTDTAVFQGLLSEYDIDYWRGDWDEGHPGNYKLTVTDSVFGRDGSDTLMHVEILQFADAVVNLGTGVTWTYETNATVDITAQDPGSPGNLYVGSGIPASGFGLATNEDAGIELGLQVIYRQGPTVLTTDTYADGVLTYQVADGPQSTANGSQSNVANRAAWNFEFSVATGLNGETTSLDDFTFKLLVDVDPTAATSYRTLVLEEETTPQGAGQSGFQWRDEGTNAVFISDDEGTANVTQNSHNYAFFPQLFMSGVYGPGDSFAGPAFFDIQLQAFDSNDVLLAQNHISVQAIL
jgi:hypothetical protein